MYDAAVPVKAKTELRSEYLDAVLYGEPETPEADAAVNRRRVAEAQADPYETSVNAEGKVQRIRNRQSTFAM